MIVTYRRSAMLLCEHVREHTQHVEFRDTVHTFLQRSRPVGGGGATALAAAAGVDPAMLEDLKVCERIECSRSVGSVWFMRSCTPDTLSPPTPDIHAHGHMPYTPHTLPSHPHVTQHMDTPHTSHTLSPHPHLDTPHTSHTLSPHPHLTYVHVRVYADSVAETGARCLLESSTHTHTHMHNTHTPDTHTP